MSEPLVSVVMGTYNHEHFVHESIQSVLAQDFPDFEFLISDDGSSDGTARVIAEHRDPRISFRPHTVNRGAALVFNELIQMARGRYVAIINSDDAWMPGKLSEQVQVLEQNPGIGAVFGRAEFVDRDGQAIDKSALSFGRVFDQPNRTRGEWLRQFFWRGNCLCHPSVMIRRSVYDSVGLYDNRLRQLPDFDMWVRVIKATGIHVSKRNMVRFRILPGENASSDTYTNRVRTLNEHLFIALGFFDNVSAELLHEGFGDYFRRPGMPDDITLGIEKAFLYMHPVQTLEHMYKIVGMMKLREMLSSADHRRVLSAEYDFDDRAFHRLEAEADGLQPAPRQGNIYVPPPEEQFDRRSGRDISEVTTRELARIIMGRLMTRARMLTGR